jgi:hypothetical protein
MHGLLAALDAFLQERRRSGELEGGVEGERVWMSCACGARHMDPSCLSEMPRLHGDHRRLSRHPATLTRETFTE